MIFNRLSRQRTGLRRSRANRKRRALANLAVCSPRVEALEDRRVLAAAIDLPESGGEFLLLRDSEDVVLIADPNDQAEEIFREPLESLEDLIITGSDADDLLRVDFSAGNPVPLGGLSFLGEDQETLNGDALELEGGSFENANYFYADPSSGSIVLEETTIEYSGLEPIASTITVTDTTLTYLGADETITVDSILAQTEVASTLGEITLFNNPTNSLTIESQSGTDTIQLQSVGAGFDADLKLDAGGDDTVDLQSAIDIGSGDLTISNASTVSPPGVQANLISAGQFRITGDLSIGGSSPGLLPVTANVNFGDPSSFSVQIDNAAAGTGYDQLAVTGTVEIDASVVLNLSGSIDPTSGGNFMIIDNDGADSVVGTFDSLPEGAEITNFLGIGRSAFLSYVGGDGNDVVIELAPANVYVDLNGDLIIDDPLGNRQDDLSIAVDGANYRISDPATELVAGPGAIQDSPNSVLVPVASVSGDIMATTRAGADSLTVDFSGGTLNHPVFYEGGAPLAGTGDQLVLTNGAATTVTHTFANESDGTSDVDGLLITYTGLEPVFDNLSAANRVFTFIGGAETITLADDGVVNDNVSQIDSTLGESVTFVNPTSSLTINAGDGNDLIDIDMVDAMYAASLIVNGNDGNDTLDIDDLSIVNSPGRGLQISTVETTTIDNSTFSGNSAVRGAGLLVTGPGVVTIDSSDFLNNVATGAAASDGGGGIYIDGASVTIQNGSNISGNSATVGSASGGGIFHNATLTVNSSSVFDNEANRAGGGIEATGIGSTSLTNVVLNDNHALANPGNGGGLHITGNGNSFITGGTASGNTAAAEGGGLWNGGGTMTIDGTTISGNTASGDAADQGGGGIFNAGGTLSVSNATISDNIADGTSGSGGGILNDASGSLTLLNSAITTNHANRAGGGIEATAGTSNGLTGVTLNGNNAGVAPAVANPGNGGGLHITGNGNATINGGSVGNNTAAAEGGGLWNGGGTMTIDGTTISGNTASGDAADQGGGGIFNAGGTLNVSNATISGNIADGTSGSGGGILNDASGSLTLLNSAITTNRANRAGGGIEATTGTSNGLTGVTLNGNNAGVAPAVANPGNGGGLHITGNGNATINGGSVGNNIAAAEGGGLWNDSGTMTVTGTTIDGNTAFGTGADQGGGGAFNHAEAGTLNLVNVVLSNNVANNPDGSGGGAMNDQGTMNVTGSTVSGNDLCGLSYVRARGQVTGNNFVGNVGAAICPLLGSSGDDTIVVQSTSIAINTDLLIYDTTLGPITINSLAGDDTFNVQSTAVANPITIDAGTGNDVINVSSDAPNNLGDLDDILGSVTISGNDNLPTLAGAELTEKGITVGDSLVIGDTLNVSDHGSAANNTYVLGATEFQRTAAIATGLISYDTIETINIVTGTGNDTVAISDTAADAATSVNTNLGSDDLTIDDSGAGGLLRVDADADDDMITLNGGGSGGMELRGSGGDDDFDIVATGSLDLLAVLGGADNDRFGVVGISAATSAQFYLDDRIPTVGDGTDLIDFGHRLSEIGMIEIGSVDGIDGAVCVDGGGGSNPVDFEASVEARRAADAAAEVLTQSVAQSDSILYSDASAVAAGLYNLTATTIDSTTAQGTVTYSAVESVQLASSHFDDQFFVASTADSTLATILPSGGNDTVTVSDTGENSITNITTGLISDAVVSDQDSITIERSGDGSIVQVDSDAGALGANVIGVSSDADNVTIERTGDGVGIEVDTGEDPDTITIGANVGDGMITPLTGNRSLIHTSSGAGEDTFQINEVFVETAIELNGDAANDTFNVTAEGSVATGNLVRINDGLPAGDGDDDVARSRELLIDGGANGATTRDVTEGVSVSGMGLASDEVVADQVIGDLVNVFANAATTDLDLRYVVTQFAHGVLATTTPVADPANRSESGNEAVETARIERVTIESGSGHDVLTLSALVPLGIASTGQVVRFDGGTGAVGEVDRFEVSGGDGDDRVTIGPISPDIPAGGAIESIEIADVPYVRVDGRGGDDQISNLTDAISVLDGGDDDDTMLGGSRSDVLTGGAGIDRIFGRDGNDILMSDHEFGNDVIIPADGELLDGGDEDNLIPGDICIQVGVDVVRSCETLGDGGAVKDVLTWLRGVLVPIDAISFNPPSPVLEPFEPVFNSPADLVSVSEPSTLGPAVVMLMAPLPVISLSEPLLDVNRDGSITALDALTVINSLAVRNATEGESISDGDQRAAEDVNGDGNVTALDALIIVNSLGRTPSGEAVSWAHAVDGAFGSDDEDGGDAEEDAPWLQSNSGPGLF